MAKRKQQQHQQIEESSDHSNDSPSNQSPEDAISSEEDEPTTTVPTTSQSITSDGRYHNKQRLLVISSRGITARYRHLLEDLRQLIPHAKKESKLDVGKNYSGGGYGAAVNEIAEVRGCHSVLFLECRKRGQDGYLWIGRTGCGGGVESSGGEGGKKHLMTLGGPSVKFHITNIHTMDEVGWMLCFVLLPFISMITF
jgi:ribosome biogenesis protein BRX1